MTRALVIVAIAGGLLRGLVLFGAGETISHVARLDLSNAPAFEAELGAESPSLGYKSEYFSVFFLDVWTGGAELVLYDEVDDQRYLPLSRAQVEELTGREASSFSPPFLYQVPLGWIVYGGLFIGAVVVTWVRFRKLP
ncbi:MAG: hypothetical protein AB8I08_09395 [Sandaracinaceae bacterium]